MREIEFRGKSVENNEWEYGGYDKAIDGESFIISVGKDGDMVLVDLDKKVKVDSNNFVSKGKNTPFEGREYYGEVVMTIKGGKVVYKA